MKILIEGDASGPVIRLIGVLSEFGNAERFSQNAMKTLDDNPKFVAVDFTEAALPDSRFISRLISLYTEAKKRGIKTYLLCNGNAEVLDLIRVSHLHAIMPLIQSVQDIVA